MRRRLQIPIFIITILVLSSVPIRAQDYLVGPDDVLKITVYREEDMDRTVRVSADGYISLPMIDNVKVEGLSVVELERAMAMELIRYLKNPKVSVFIEEYATITVSGQVEKPGSFSLKGGLTAVEAISMAGGFTKIAAKNAVKCMRVENGEKKSITVKVEAISKRGDNPKDIPLKRGAIVFVQERLF